MLKAVSTYLYVKSGCIQEFWMGSLAAECRRLKYSLPGSISTMPTVRLM